MYFTNSVMLLQELCGFFAVIAHEVSKTEYLWKQLYCVAGRKRVFRKQVLRDSLKHL